MRAVMLSAPGSAGRGASAPGVASAPPAARGVPSAPRGAAACSRFLAARRSPLGSGVALPTRSAASSARASVRLAAARPSAAAIVGGSPSARSPAPAGAATASASARAASRGVGWSRGRPAPARRARAAAADDASPEPPSAELSGGADLARLASLESASPTDEELDALLRCVEGCEDLSECQVADHPELGPLKDAVQNAKARLESARSARDEAEAAAQEAGDAALTAAAAAAEATERAGALEADATAKRDEFEAVSFELGIAREREAEERARANKAAVAADEADAAETAGAGASEGAEAAGDVEAARSAAETGASSGGVAAGASGDAAPTPAPAEAPQAEHSPARPTRAVAVLEPLVASLEPSTLSAEALAAAALAEAAASRAAAADADRAAAAAMAAAEAAVHDEFELVAVVETATKALERALQDIQTIEDASERRNVEWSKQEAQAAGAAADEVLAAGPAPGDVAAAADAAAACSPSSASAAAGLAHSSSSAAEASASAAGAAASAGGAPAGSAAAAAPSAASTAAALASMAASASAAASSVASEGSLAAEGSEGSSSPPEAFNASASVPGSPLLALLARVPPPLRLAALGALALALPPVREALSRAAASSSALLKRLPLPHVHGPEKTLLETICLLASSVFAVPAVCRMPGGSPVLGFLASGALVGPYALGIVKDVASMRHVAELGVVFLLFNIGLELSFERLKQLRALVFGLGASQVVATTALGAAVAKALLGSAVSPAGAVVLGGGLALSTTAVAMPVLADRGEAGSTHGRAAFCVLLFQDLAAVALLMLVPLLAPQPAGAAAGQAGSAAWRLASALGLAGLRAVVCMCAIVVVGRKALQPLYRRVSEAKNPDILAALTLLVVLGTSLVTQLAGLSLALGAFLAGLLLAETPFHLQIEADIAPYKGLLMGLFFMTVGMEISVGLLFARLATVLGTIALLIAGKAAVVWGLCRAFGLSGLQGLRAGALLAPGGEFAFVLFGEAVARNLLPAGLVRELYLAVALSMALTPFLAEGAAKLSRRLSKSDVAALGPRGDEAAGLRGHVILAGYGRVGRLIAEMLASRLVPFVALDSDPAAVAEGRASDIPVYFGDAGSPSVLHALGAGNAGCAVITLDTPAANYRAVWTLRKHFPNVPTYARARDVDHGILLEKAGATAVVPETLEPALQLAAATLTALDFAEDDVAETIRAFRKTHLAQLQELAAASGSTLGYGAARKKQGAEGATKTQG